MAVTAGPTNNSTPGNFNTNLVQFAVAANNTISIAATFQNCCSSDSGPALAASATELAFPFLSESTSGSVNSVSLVTYTAQVNGTLAASPVEFLNETAFGSPAAAFFGGNLYLAWTGTDGARTLNIAQVQ